MDFEIFKTMLIPIVLGYLFYNSISGLGASLVWLSVSLLLNGLILYFPKYLPGGNKDTQTLTRAEGLLMGLGGAASMLPGISCTGAVTSIATACGADKGYAFDLALLAHIPVTLGLVIFDILALINQGMSGMSLTTVLSYIVSALTAFGGVYLGMRIMRSLIKNNGVDIFAYYSLGTALFTFILFLNI